MQKRNNVSRKLNLLFLNIRSLKKKLNELKVLAITKKADVIILNETWIKTNEERFLKSQVTMLSLTLETKL